MRSVKEMQPFRSVFPIVDGRLQIGGIAIDRLVDRAGGTPLYAVDRHVVTATIDQLRARLPTEVQLHYSVKANPMPALVQHMAQLVNGFDVASGSELKTVLDTTMDPSSISFTGPGKVDRDLTMAVAAGVIVHLESEGEMMRVDAIGERLGITPKVALRVNPDFELKLSGMKMSGGAKQFGIDAEDIPRVLKRVAGCGLDWVGFHLFCGSQSLRSDAIADAQSKMIELAVRLADNAPSPLRMLNIGGGFGIPYFPGETELDLEPVAENLHALMPRRASQLPTAKLVIELGRYLVGGAGVYVTRVVDRKVSRGKIFLVTDGGMNHHLAASGNLGQKIRKNYPLAVGNKMDVAATEKASVAGPLCTPLDLLGDEVNLAPAEPGDLIVIFQSGAYGPSASPTGFLGHPVPTEVLV